VEIVGVGRIGGEIGKGDGGGHENRGGVGKKFFFQKKKNKFLNMKGENSRRKNRNRQFSVGKWILRIEGEI
jgi:hypothetical protein